VVLVGTSAAGGQRLWVRDLDTLAARELSGTDGASQPFWSPDGQWIGFYADRQLKKIAVTGGPVVTVCSAPDFRGGTWNQDGVILFAPGALNQMLALQQVSASGGTPSAVTSLGDGETGHVRPRFLPDGKHFTFFVSGPNAVFLGSLDSTAHTPLVSAPVGAGVAYSQGHLLFLRGTALMAQPFDLDTLEVSGQAVPVADEIKTVNRPEIGLFSASANGVLVYQAGTSAPNTELTWFDRRGTVLGTIETPGRLGSVALSPDGSRVAFSRTSATGKEDVWVHEFARNTSNRLTAGQRQDWMAVWSPDGTRIVWESDRRGTAFRDLYQKTSNGAGTDELLLESPISKYPYDWSSDGRFLMFADLVPTRPGRYQLWALPMTGDARTPTRYLETDSSATDARFSPNGRYLAYHSDASGRNEVYVQPFPEAAGGKWIVSQGGGTEPRWRRDGRELFYLSADEKLMSVDVATNAVFTPTPPKALFAVSRPRGSFSSQYDVAADGQRFLINVLPPDAAPRGATPVIVTLNWTAGLTPSPAAKQYRQ
jgi:Tol biopolymer transport system component